MKKQDLSPFLSKEWINKFKIAMKEYGNSPIGITYTKTILTAFVTLGLFVGGIQMAVTNNLVIGLVLIAFGGIQWLDLKTLWKQYKLLKEQTKIIKEYKGDI